jgi:cytochrome b pre-mRNA-processing protein 3
VFGRLFRRDTESDAIAASLYGAIVAQARNPVLYADFGVADSVDGRFEMVVLHTVLVVERLREGGDREKQIAQKIFDLYNTDMDRSLRELGVGDLGVPKRMKKMAERFYGRASAYGQHLRSADRSALADAIARNVFGAPVPGAQPLAGYALASFRLLQATPSEKLVDAGLQFADPGAFVSAEAPA